ncbi:NADP-dependent oxidoreductase domain-containing protein [Gamsiella multidivaricata]|uniref:NADP-dependent oxidoreductase domain-containing protein n=1 Tax=Gamsiella multidivaricata TaxID=101098 RepID=UPI0022207D4D|nr:NADP-dependent oxidoreductase domain-containing protein [Gamsiella multidivaricata]KAI7817164.1 NADP-dependent oxidoreductase domain-containing protein [Gamsiella multidivaricata]
MTSPTPRAISRLGVGAYRLALGVPEHERVLYKALERQKDPRHNINLIDTSSNYSDGKSELLIGKVLSHPRRDTLRRDEVVISTKFGYIQNKNMRLLSEGVFQKVPPEEIVKYSPECYHCIHPEFMRDQLTRSLERLRTKFVDILFVHNPEYYLMSNIKHTEVNVKNSPLTSPSANKTKDFERPGSAVRPYLVTSTYHSLPQSSHGLAFLQMPGNLLEMEGVETTAKWAKDHGLGVFLNRPLNAMSLSRQPVRLASYPPPQAPTYVEAKTQVLESLCVLSQRREYLQPKMQRLTEMIEDLDASLRTNKLSIIHMEGASIKNLLHQELARPVKVKGLQHQHLSIPSSNSHESQYQEQEPMPTDVEGPNHTPTQSHGRSSPVPYAKPSVQEIDRLITHLDHFVRAFHQQVRSQESDRVKKMLTDRGIDLKGSTVEQFAIEYLLEYAQVNSVLLGMKRQPYVDFAREMLKIMVGTK